MSSVALISGATSPLGRALVQRLAFAGIKVAACDMCKTTTSQISEENRKVGGDVTAFPFDVAQPEQRKELLQKVEEELGTIDSLVIVPPTNAIIGNILDSKQEEQNQILTSHLTLPLRMAQDSMSFLAKSGNGSITLIGSALGLQPVMDLGLYSLVNTSLVGLTKVLALSAGREGVRVNSVLAGMFENDGSSGVWSKSSNELSETVRQNLASMTPVGRIGRLSDVSHAVEFLISSNANFISGEHFVISGGVSYRL